MYCTASWKHKVLKCDRNGRPLALTIRAARRSHCGRACQKRSIRCGTLPSVVMDVQDWLRQRCHEYQFDLRGVYRAHGTHDWPISAENESALEYALSKGGHL